MKTKSRLFPNGTSLMTWLGRNCDKCVKRFDPSRHKGGQSDCDIEKAIFIASETDGTLTLCNRIMPLNKAAAIAKRLHWDGQRYLTQNCPEFLSAD